MRASGPELSSGAARTWLPRARPIRAWTTPAVLWMAALSSAICFEGLGRKFLPQVPAVAFYFLKDAVLLLGLVRFGWRRPEVSAARFLYRGFGLAMAGAVLWTGLEIFNPAQAATALAVVGFRSYWLWWAAPMVVAGALRERGDRDRVIVLLSLIAVVVAANAAIQFALPASAHSYALYEGEEVVPVAVASTGKARVSSTFAYISGFSDFVILVPAVLLSMGLNAKPRGVRKFAWVGTAASVAVMPMTGSRGPVVLSLGTVVLVVLGSGLGSRAMRRAVIASLFAVGLAYFLGPEAIEGVQDRFEGRDTRGRFAEVMELLPPVALARNEYPMLGSGTGMQQNARVALRVHSDWETEGEPGRYLIELGVPGYLLVWFARLGLAVALLRAALELRRAGRGAVAGAAGAYALLALGANLTFDHVFQALFFLGAGLILAEFVEVRSGRRPERPKAAAGTLGRATRS